MKLKIALLLCVFLSIMGVSSSIAQSFPVSGKITSQDTNEPLEGVTVTVKGTSEATTTDKDGNYTINVPKAGSVLVFTYVDRISEEYTVRDNSPYSVALQSEGGAMQEVMVNVGYGSQRKSVLTGAISSVNARQLEKVPNGRIEQALQGRVAGVTIMQNAGQPGAGSTIRIRGITTFGMNEPLWVVDGIVVDAGAIGYLNQSDIESIEVMKDATSSAIYGTRAAAGVILVTTKKGKAGKLSVSYNGFMGTSSTSKKLDLLNATQYATLMNEKSVGGGGSVIYPDLSIFGKGTDWQKEIFNNDARRYSHELSLSGGSEKSMFYASFGMQDQQGIVLSNISNYNRKSFRLNSTHKISKIFTFGQTLGYTHQKSMGIGNTNSEFGGPLSSAINLDPITKAVVTDPTEAGSNIYVNNPVIRDANGNPYGISSYVGQEMTNPVAYQATRLGHHNWSDDIIGNAFLEIKIGSDIKFTSTLGGKLAYWGGQGFTPVYYLSPTVGLARNNYGKSTNNTLNWNLENTITYSKKIKDHDFSILLGQGAYVDNNGGGSAVTLLDLPVNSYLDASFNFDIPEANRTSGSWDFVNHKLSSLFSRLNYNYKEKYLLTGIVRRDGSTRFGSNNKYGVFPSFSLGWNVFKEDFWVNNDYIKALKIRGGYGTVGNDGIGDFRYLSTVEGGYNYTMGNGGIINTGYAPSTLDNPDLKWESTSQMNIGFDAQIFKNFSITVDAYKKKTSDILRPIRIPGYVGVSQFPAANIADMENTGVELELGYRKTFGQLNFSLSGNVSTLKNKVTYVNADADFIDGGAGFQSMGSVTRIQVGQSYNAFYGFETAGIFQNWAEVNAYAKSGGLIQPNAQPGDFRWVDRNDDGVINASDRTFLGSSLPKLTYGFTLNLDMKGFDFMLFAQGAAGNKIFQGLRRLDVGNANYQTRALSRWTGEGTSNDYPRLTSNDPNGNFTNMSDFYLEKGDYLRLKILTLGYSYVNAKVLDKIGASRIRLYVTGENLLTLTNYTGYDPEIGGGVFGIDKGFYPQARTFLIGAQLQF